jgi:uncharacterized LabA/DUF88 family protein
MKTAIYIDGYNFYYSRLKGKPYKWLDIVSLFRDMIALPQQPDADIVAVKFFTAPVKASYARHGTRSEQAQTQYHRALQAKHPDLIEIIQGFHVFEPTTMPAFQAGTPPNKDNGHRVWLIEEKQRDVNMALHIYRDAVRGDLQQQIICTNDSDLEPALKLVRADAPGMQIGLVMPLRPPHASGQAISNKRLTELAHWTRKHILDSELEKAQLQDTVPTRKKPALKPAHWH